MSKIGFKIKGKEKSTLIKNRMDSINMLILTKKIIYCYLLFKFIDY